MKKLVLVMAMLLILSVLDACGGGVTAVPGTAGSGKGSADMIDVTTKTLPDAVAELKAAGFTNVTSNQCHQRLLDYQIFQYTHIMILKKRGKMQRGMLSQLTPLIPEKEE